MNMESWKPYLHTSLWSDFARGGEPFLFPTFLVNSTLTFLGSALFTAALALFERLLTALLEATSRTRPFVRTVLFFVVTLARYLLMIISMGMDWFIILVLVASLSLGQLVIELRQGRECNRNRNRNQSQSAKASRSNNLPLSSRRVHQEDTHILLDNSGLDSVHIDDDDDDDDHDDDQDYLKPSKRASKSFATTPDASL